MTKTKQTSALPPLKGRPWWVKILAYTAGFFGMAAMLIVGIATLAVWILTPEKLTPIVEETASSYLNAEVKAKRVELTYWSSWPRLSLEVDSLTVVSHSLQGISMSERSLLPADADTLLTLEHFEGGIHMLNLMKNKLSLYDVQLKRPMLNLVALDSTHVNYDIVPTEPEEEPNSTPMPFTAISINKFEITGGFPIRYFSAADSTNVAFTLHDSSIKGENEPTYAISISGHGSSHMPKLPIDSLYLGMNGDLTWDPFINPMALELNNFNIQAGKLAMDFSAKIDARDSIKINSLDINAPHLGLSDAIDIIPATMRGELAKISTDLEVALNIKLLRPYIIGSNNIPWINASITIPDGTLRYEQLYLQRINADIEAMVNGDNLDKSTVNVKNFTAVARAMGFAVSGKVSTPLSNPTVSGKFKGGVSLTRIPKVLWRKLGMEMKGLLTGEADFKLRQSWLNAKNFHKVSVNGHLTLSDFELSDSANDLRANMHKAKFDLGSRSKLDVNGYNVDSLLTASLQIDTIWMASNGMEIAGRGLKAGVGARNVASTTDTTQINPIGGAIKAELLTLHSESDTISVRIKNASVNASLRRYNQDSRAPHLGMTVAANRIRYADALNRVTLREASVNAQLHPRKLRKMGASMQARYDSIAALHPELSSDSIMALARPKRRNKARQEVNNQRENMDFGVDGKLRKALRQWQLEGSLQAKRGRLLTPFLPLRNTLRNLDMKFNTDSITLTNTKIVSGQSDFTLNGKLNNISRALTSRRGAPITLEFSMRSDTVNINQLTDALLAGAAFADKLSKGTVTISNSDSDEAVQKSIDNATATENRAALIVPANVQANLKLNAKNVIYGDLALNRCRGAVEVYDGAIRISPLSARTAIGSVTMSALYTAPNIDSLSFATGINIKRLHLGDVLNMVGGIDTIMPLLKSVDGIVDADMAMSTRLDSMLNFDLASVDMALKLSGDSLVLMDSETFRTLGKWLMFKDKQNNMIDHMTVEMMVKDSRLNLFPFIFDMDRYKLGVAGGNDMGLNLDYHVAVLKSPLPFKFGINIKGTPEDMKISLGKARLNEKSVATTRNVADTIRINLVNEISRAFKAGIRRKGSPKLEMDNMSGSTSTFTEEQLSRADSIAFIQQGLMEAPKGFEMPDSTATDSKNSKKKDKKKRNKK